MNISFVNLLDKIHVNIDQPSNGSTKGKYVGLKIVLIIFLNLVLSTRIQRLNQSTHH